MTQRGDEIWRGSREKLTQIAVDDLARIGLIERDDLIDSTVKKIPYAYPVYEVGYKENLQPMMDYVRALDNIHTTGRQGNFRYNNMDQSVEMGRKMAGEISSGLETGHEAVATGEEYFG